MQSVDERSSGKTINLAIGQLVEIRLPENRTTGFRWELTLAGSACIAVDDDFELRTTTPGQGGVHVWRFKALHAGPCNIQGTYRRTWEAAGPAARAFTLHVRVAS